MSARRRSRRGPGLSIAEAAERLDISRVAVEKLIKQGRLDIVEFGAKKRIPVRSVDVILDQMGLIIRGVK
jgi:excisionase family DNA binding protein